MFIKSYYNMHLDVDRCPPEILSVMNMNKTAVFSFTLLIILVSQISLSFASYTPTITIPSSGMVKEKVAELITIRKLIVAYGTWGDEYLEHIAKFDLVDLGFEVASKAVALKTLNPNIFIIAYKNTMAMYLNYEDWAEVNGHEDWFLHDVNGNRLINKDWGWYAMDVGNSGWRAHYANSAKAKLDAYPMVDGIFADDTWDMFWTDAWLNNAVPDPSIAPRWHNDMIGFLRYVKSVIGSKLLIPNTTDNADYVDVSDGKMQEGFTHTSWWGLDEFPTWYNWKEKIDALASLSSRGKYYLADSGAIIPESPTSEDLEKARKVMLYCVCSYLLGVSGPNASFGWNDIYSKDGSRGYYPEFDVSLGSSVNEYYSVGSVYARDFAGGKVLVNPTTSIYTVNLDGEYKTLDGQKVSNVTLDDHSGVILLSL